MYCTLPVNYSDFLGDVGIAGAVVVAPGPVLDLCNAVFKVVPSLEPIESPYGVFAPRYRLSNMFVYLMKQLGVAKAVLALCGKMLNTLYLANKLWRLSHCN